MKIKMELLSDAIFGNGMSVPGAEDISVQHDGYGFPYYKGGTFKGIFREELERYLEFSGRNPEEIKDKTDYLLGTSGNDSYVNALVFSDFELSGYVKQQVLKEKGTDSSDMVLSLFTHMRTFTSIDENGLAKKGSLRKGRCVDKGLCFYSIITCPKEEEQLVKDTLSMIKWIGSMRNRGFGKVKISVIEEAKR